MMATTWQRGSVPGHAAFISVRIKNVLSYLAKLAAIQRELEVQWKVLGLMSLLWRQR